LALAFLLIALVGTVAMLVGYYFGYLDAAKKGNNLQLLGIHSDKTD